MIKPIANWGKYPQINVSELCFDTVQDLYSKFNGKSFIARGNGRCYGDASLSSQIASTLKFNKFIEWNENTGELTCQSGVLLSEILEIFVPKGWFLPVTPGTKFITVGGAVASDVHGKNHHIDGSFSRHVTNISLLIGTGEVINCTKQDNPDLFWATCGGMGLTGVILHVTFKLKKISSAFINYKQIKAKNLSEILELFNNHNNSTYSVAWIDCLKTGNGFGRSILMLGETAADTELMNIKDKFRVGKEPVLSVPFNFPSLTLNKLTIRIFNSLYYNKNLRKSEERILHYDPFFYPLDSILEWNRIYGKKGFVQYQFVLPFETGKNGIEDILRRISEKGIGSFLAVLKLFGEQNDLISFPMKGYTLALDIPIRSGLFTFLDELDRLVSDFGGRIYLSKDARMSSEIFWKTYPNAGKFQEIIHRTDPDLKFVSMQSKRLKLKG